VVAYLGSLRQILIYGDLSDADMEKGQMRCDVNVSVRPPGQAELGTKIELKNMNSPSAVRRALHYEIDRQVRVLGEGGELVQSTRRWNEELGETRQMRIKESDHDYRYFPDPDLLPVRTAAILDKVRALVPELPHQKAARFVSEFGISEYDASVISSDRELARYFEAAAQGSAVPKKVANWVINNVLGALNERALPIADCPVAAPKLAALVALVEAGKLSNGQAKEVFIAMFAAPEKEPAELAAELGFEPVTGR